MLNDIAKEILKDLNKGLRQDMHTEEWGRQLSKPKPDPAPLAGFTQDQHFSMYEACRELLYACAYADVHHTAAWNQLDRAYEYARRALPSEYNDALTRVEANLRAELLRVDAFTPHGAASGGRQRS